VLTDDRTDPARRTAAPATARLRAACGSLLLHAALAALIFGMLATSEVPAPPRALGERSITAVLLEAPRSAPPAAPAMASQPQPQTPTPVSTPAPRPPAPRGRKTAPETPSPPATVPQTAEAVTAPVQPAAAESASATAAALAVESAAAGAAHSDEIPWSYLWAVKRAISEHRRYPRAAYGAGQTGTAVVRIHLSRDGSLLGVALLKSSGYRLLDEEARAVIERIGRFPPLPARYAPGRAEFAIDQPIGFQRRPA